MEINAVNVGGSEGCRRLRELKKEIQDGKRVGWSDVEKRKKAGDTTQYEYRFVSASQQLRFQAIFPLCRTPVRTPKMIIKENE